MPLKRHRPAPITRVMSSAAPGLRADPLADGYFEHARPELRALVPAGARRVLDVGCGGGALGAALKAERGCEVVGLEGMPEAAATAATRLDAVHEVDLERLGDLPYPPGHFDAIVLGDVLEHLRDPEAVLAALLPHLAADGALVMSIPNVKHWSVVVPLLLRDAWTYTDAGLLDRTHVHFFTLEEISAMLDRLGLTARELSFTTVGAVPAAVEPLLDAVVEMGGERDETAARLGAYQYLVVAGRAG